MIQAVIFDMDGVLLDSEPLHDMTNLEILRSFGIEADTSVTNAFVGRTSAALWEAMISRYSLQASIDDLIDRQWRINIEKLPSSGIIGSEGLEELLSYLKEHRIKLSVASSSRNDFVEAVFDHLNLWEYMETYTGGSEVKLGKPSPEIYLRAAEKIGMKAAACLTVEDSTAGVQSSKAAGMYTVGYLNPTSDGQDLSEAEAIVSSLLEVRGILEKRNSEQKR